MALAGLALEASDNLGCALRALLAHAQEDTPGRLHSRRVRDDQKPRPDLCSL
jgi:hypothetical protein